ncbi:NDR1/HIN1-like protein 26 [Selaginella moellendorffii]|uniref:NDR1/HIN1-like protein 26 n=1 Tax=Selaginella moellendorffii TaxID=88036 RepID=UPI000D1C8362|nr:NDR1/HIN1-like protein 26 [Selaginella moellendorffii]|eukprot:XP_002993525.2 NDR1/HIN1-like protein 26 [Selaginella moellendorffii]
MTMGGTGVDVIVSSAMLDGPGTTAARAASVSAVVNRSKVHHILEDAVLSNLSASNSSSQGSRIDSASLTFKVWSRNANKKMGVHFWHLRIAAVYRGYELGRAYASPFVQPPRNITHFEAPLQLFNLTIPLDLATKLKGDLDSGQIPMRINVKMRAKYKRVDKSWQTKLISGDLHGDDKCNLLIGVSSTNRFSSLKGRQCGWTVAFFNPNQGA